MQNTEKKNKSFWLTIALAAIIIMLAGLAFIPTVTAQTKRAATANARAGAVDPEAMRVLGCCAAYVAANDFSTTMKGAVKARVMGLPYTQTVKGSRSVKGGDFCDVTESASVFVKAGIKHELTDGVYAVYNGEYKNGAFAYPARNELSRDEYVARYGKPFTGITRYVTEGAIVKAEQTAENTYKYTLDPERATAYSRNEVKTTLNSKSYPDYSSVEITVTVDRTDKPLRVTSVEKFKIDKFGGVNCTATYTEVFDFA